MADQPTTETESIRPTKGRIAGVDYGTVRIGIATANLDLGIAGAFENYNRRNERLDKEYFQILAKEERIVRFVVGLPVHLSGEESQKSYEAREFGKWLQDATCVEVEFFDERFTTSEARELLLQTEMTSKQRKKKLDMMAAQILLTAYLEAGAKGQTNPGALDG